MSNKFWNNTSKNAPCPCGSGKKYKRCCLNRISKAPHKQTKNSISNLLGNHNTIDLIKTFAGLTVMAQNHGKNIRLEELTKITLINRNNKTTHVPLKRLIGYLNDNYASHHMEDPSTNLFTDLITFHGGDYIIFPGITDGGSYVLSNLLYAIYQWPNSGIPEQFKNHCIQISLFILKLSDTLARRLGYGRYEKGKVGEEVLTLPNVTKLEKLKEAVTFSRNEIHELLKTQGISAKVIELFLLDLNSPISDDYRQESPFLIYPIIQHGEEYIIASPATLSFALVDTILREAKKFNTYTEVENAYHDIIWNITQLHLKRLGFSKLNIPDVSQNNVPNIRQGIYRFDDDKLAHVQYIAQQREDDPKEKQNLIDRILRNPDFIEHQFIDITLFSSMGKEMLYMFSKTENSRCIAMPIHDFETLVNLKEYNAIDLWNFATATEQLFGDMPIFGPSFLDIFKLYKEKNDSFYLSDEIAKVIPFIQPGYAEDLYIKAKLLKDEHSGRRLHNGRMALVPVERMSEYAPIYCSIDETAGGELNFLVEGFTQPIWVTPDKNSLDIEPKAKGLYYQMADAIAYWLWQCQDYIKNDIAALGDMPIVFKFEFIDENSFHNNVRNYVRDPNLINHFSVRVIDYNITITIPPSINPYLYGADNEGERHLVRQLVRGLNQLLEINDLETIEADKINEIVENAAPLGMKKKIFLVDTADNLLLDPSNLEEPRYLQPYNADVIMEHIVPELGDLCPPLGPITEKETKVKLTRDIVMRVLLPKLQLTISQYDNETLLKRLIRLNESLIHKREELRIKTPTRIACFVSEEEQVNDLHNSLAKLNQTSMAVRCLIEHLAAEPSTGNKIVSITAIDELIALMSAIIQWGSLGDQITYELFDIEMGILPSGRVGTSKTLNKEIFDPYYTSKSKENVKDALDTFDQAFPQRNPVEGGDVPEGLNAAFLEEFSISFERICEFINDLGIIAYAQSDSCASISRNELFVEINKHAHTYTQEEFDHAMSYLCLTSRGNVMNVPEGFDGFDISPWRFSRRLSLLRKPIVSVNNPEEPENPIVYWGFRQLLIARMNLYDQCVTNRLKVIKGGPVERVLGKLAQRRGVELVKAVLQEVDSTHLIIDAEVPINTKSQLKHDKDIGDVDVLLIDQPNKIIYSLECKSMATSRNIKEMVEEVTKLFGSSSKKGWIDKHVERDTWLKDNLDLVGIKYKLNLSDYSVKSFFITQEDMLTPYLKTRKTALPFVTLYTLQEKGLEALN